MTVFFCVFFVFAFFCIIRLRKHCAVSGIAPLVAASCSENALYLLHMCYILLTERNSDSDLTTCIPVDCVINLSSTKIQFVSSETLNHAGIGIGGWSIAHTTCSRGSIEVLILVHLLFFSFSSI